MNHSVYSDSMIILLLSLNILAIGYFIWYYWQSCSKERCCDMTGFWQNMMTSSNGNISRVTGHMRVEFTRDRWISPAQRPVTRSFDVFFDLSPNKRLSKHTWGWWFDTPSHPLWYHCNDITDAYRITNTSIVGIASTYAEIFRICN